MNDKEPYRATKLWNEVIAAFKAGMPLKKHRRRMQSYVDCFTASEAVTWLHCFLLNNQNFGPNVTRAQTINLLQKFLKCHVIESAILKSKKIEFLDDSHIYKFNSVSLNQSRPSALCLIQSPSACKVKSKNGLNDVQKLPISMQIQKENLPECHLVERKISSNEIKAIWEKVTLSRLEILLPHIKCNELLKNPHIDGLLLKHNVSRLSKTGVVCLVDKTDDIPHWVISAMKCLANWPNASGSGSCLPNYPGFEKDVFKVVRDFFINPRVPLLPEFLTSLLIQVFCHYVPKEFYECGDSNKTSLLVSDMSHNSKSSHVSASFVKTSTPLSNESAYKNYSHHLDGMKKESLHEDLDAMSHFKDMNEGKLLLDDPTVMWDYPTEVYFETDFGTSQPITRVISNIDSRSNSFENQMGSIESVSTISVCSQRPCTPIDRKFNTRSPLKPWSSNMYLQDEVRDTPQWMKTATAFSRLSISEQTPLQKERIAESQKCYLSQYTSEPVYVCEMNDLNVSNLSSKTITESTENVDYQEASSVRGSSQSLSAMCTRDFSSPANQTKIRCNNFVERYGKTFIEDNIYSDDLKSSFQLFLLFLPSANRRQLHLLLRLINKILKNGKFIVDSNTNMREYLIDTFLPAIVQSDEVTILCLYQMTAFLLDYCEFIFQPPAGLREEAIEICRQSSGRIRFTMDDTCFLTYCEMVSKQQYEEQKKTTSVAALRDLLNNIISDGKLSEKERKRKLKQFKSSHPDIYMLQFPDGVEPSAKQKSSFFNKLANLRM